MFKNPHYWGILFVLAIGSVAYYADCISVTSSLLEQLPFQYSSYAAIRIFFIIPVVYAASVFHLWGGLLTTAITAIILLPRALYISKYQLEATIETITILIISITISWLIGRQLKALHHSLTKQQEFSDSINTARRQQQYLELSEALYRGLFENAAEAIFICTTGGFIVSLNHAAEKLVGAPSASIINDLIQDTFIGLTQDMVEKIASETDEGEAKNLKELSLIREDGGKIFVDVKISPLLRDREVVGLQVIAHDITEEKQLRESIDYYLHLTIRAQEDERLRISRELHDDSAQMLANMSRSIKSISANIDAGKQPDKEQLVKLHAMADKTLESIRRFSQDLRPSILDDLGIVPALRWLMDNLKAECSIETNFTVSGEECRLSQQAELNVFRIAQETLSNIKNHARASQVELLLYFGNDTITMVISDNGRGFIMPGKTSELLMSGHLGIIGMHERARLIGGKLNVHSDIGQGTIMNLRVPRIKSKSESTEDIQMEEEPADWRIPPSP